MKKILWLDDDFQPITEDLSEDLKEKRKRMHQALDDATLFGFEVDPACFFDEFREKLIHYQQYDVIVLDLKGLDRDDPSNNRVFKDAKKLIKELPIRAYVYSGTKNDDPRLSFFLEEFEMEDGGIIVSKTEDIPSFFNRIKKDFAVDEFQQYYKGNEYCKELISRGYLNPTDQILGAMNQIMQHYHERDRLYAPYNNMRIIMENMLTQLANIGEIQLSETPIESNKRFNARIKYISREYHMKKANPREPDYDRPLYPFEKCPKEIKIIISFLGDVVNNWSHYLNEHPDYLQEGKISTDYNVHIQTAAYESFLLTMKWYLGRRLAIANTEKKREVFKKLQEEHMKTILDEQIGLKVLGKINLDAKGNPIK